jgi:myo-inositol-1(or 4)-monophosphatase
MTRDDELFEFGKTLALESGAQLLRFFGHVEKTEKSENDVVTIADHTIEKFVVDRILQKYPESQIISEESRAGAATLSNECWVLDPLDGTVGFAAGIYCWAVSLALLRDGAPIMGWIFDPVHNELFHARKGSGSFLNANRLTVPADPRLLPGGISSGLLEESARNGWILPMLKASGKSRILGSQALHLCYVAAGRLRMNMNWNCKIWDDAAGALIVEEAGGRYSDYLGAPIFPVGSGGDALAGKEIRSLAAPPAEHAKWLAMLQQYAKPQK